MPNTVPTLRGSIRVLLLGITLTGVGMHNARAVTFLDNTFNNDNWTSTEIIETTPGGASVTAGQTGSGGNPGAFREVTQTYVGNIGVAHLDNTALYNPTSSGSLSSVDFGYDLIRINPSTSAPDVGYAGLLFQDGSYYGAPPDTILTASWTHFAHAGLLASDFTRIVGAGPATPDFSATGAPIQFGYFTFNGSVGGTVSLSTDSGIDNWTVSASSTGGLGSTIPEPSTIGLVVSGVSMLALMRRRFARSH